MEIVRAKAVNASLTGAQLRGASFFPKGEVVGRIGGIRELGRVKRAG